MPSRLRLPTWLRKPWGNWPVLHELKGELRRRGLATVCEEARCPNLGECWSQKTATFMILGEVCTRHCGFCSVTAGIPQAVDPEEPARVSEMAGLLGLKHVVITCVARDDLPDGGAAHFAAVLERLHADHPDTATEVLTTDFGMNDAARRVVLRARPNVFNHNLETVPRLSPRVRHRASYENSLEFLTRLKADAPGLTTKSGLMLGLGETDAEVREALSELRRAGVSIVTIGQYLQPTPKNLPVVEYVAPERFAEYERIGLELGFSHVASGPFVRSSYHAGEMV